MKQNIFSTVLVIIITLCSYSYLEAATQYRIVYGKEYNEIILDDNKISFEVPPNYAAVSGADGLKILNEDTGKIISSLSVLTFDKNGEKSLDKLFDKETCVWFLKERAKKHFKSRNQEVVFKNEIVQQLHDNMITVSFILDVKSKKGTVITFTAYHVFYKKDNVMYVFRFSGFEEGDEGGLLYRMVRRTIVSL